MNHCKNKQKHKWENKFGILVECSVCEIVKIFKTMKRGGRYAKGAFGSRKFYSEFNGKVIRRSERTKENSNQYGVTI